MKALMTFAVLITLIGVDARAHSFSDSFLTIDNTDAIVHSEWQLSLQDLEIAVGLDMDQDGRISWGELRNRKTEVEAYALGRLSYASGAGQCRHLPQEFLVDARRDVPYAVLRFDSACDGAKAGDSLNVTYRAMFDVDPQHRGLIAQAGGQTAPLIVRGEATSVDLASNGATLATSLAYVQEGMWHIWSGTDHLLFLLTLLLGVVCVSQVRPAWKDSLMIVTAFTVAHSVTLVLGALHIISVSSFWIEFVIAASIAVAALANLVPRLEPYRILLALGFGLIHGFGFAGVLEEMSISGSAFAIALASFNVGVEIGQLAVVAAFLMVSHAWLHMGIDPSRLKQIGSTAVAATGIAWAVYRAVA